MDSEKNEMSKEAPSTSLRAGKIEKAKELMEKLKKLELSEEELEKVNGGIRIAVYQKPWKKSSLE